MNINTNLSEPTLFNFEEKEKIQTATKKEQIIPVAIAEKADWKNENGEEICIFVEKKDTGYIEVGLTKNYDEKNSTYNNTNNSYHGIAVIPNDGTRREKDPLPLLHALAHPNNENVKLLNKAERKEFDVIMRNINPEYKKAYEERLKQEKRNKETNAGKNATNYVLEKLKTAGIEVVTDKDEFDKRLNEIIGTDIFQAMTEKFDKAEQIRQTQNKENSVPRATKEIRESIEYVLEKIAVPLTEVDYTRENYQQIFRDGIIQSPIETIKMSPNQFVRLCPPDRNNLMGAIYDTMTKPSIVIEKETFDEKSEKFKPIHVYGKSFINKKNNHTRAVECLIIFRDGENIAASLHNRDIEKVIGQIKTADDIIYLDNEASRVAAFSINAGDSHVVKETEKFLSSSGQKSLPSWNKFYNPEKILSIKKLIEEGKVKEGSLEITKGNFDKYFNIFNQNTKVYKDNPNKIASDLFNYHVKSENKSEMKEWLEGQGYKIKEKTHQFKISNDKVYGFTDGEKIYLNPDFLNSNVAVHEYTHLWDEYTRRTNSELWQKGMDILKGIKLFAEVKNDPNYADIADNDDLVLSEVHARICGELAQEYLEQIAREDGKIKSIDAYDWNKKVTEYIANELFPNNEIFYQKYHTDGIKENEIDSDAITRFLLTPMIDLAKGLSVKHRDFKTRFENGDFTEIFERLSDINFKTNIYKTMKEGEQKKEYEKLWNKLFSDGEPKEIQEKRLNWQRRVKEYENGLKLPETLEKAKSQAKKMPSETIKERLEQYKKNEYGFHPQTAEEAAERNETEFKDNILNTLGRQHNQYDHWLNWDDVYVWNSTKPMSNVATELRISILENELKKRGVAIEIEKQSEEKNMEQKETQMNELSEKEQTVLSKPLSTRTKTWFKNENKTIKDMLDLIVQYNGHDFDLKKSDSGEIYIQGYDNGMKPRGRMAVGLTELNYLKERLTNEAWLKDIKKFNEEAEIEKLYTEVNPNGGNDRGFQFGVKDLEHLKGIKQLLDDFEKNPPKHSELEDFEKSEKRYSRESKRLQKIYENEHDKDALKGAQKNADYANFYHWQVEKLNKDIIQHPNEFDSIKKWYEKAYPTDKELVEKMSEYVVFGQLESDLENGVGYGQPNSSFERYGEYDSIVRERLFQKLSEIDNVDYDVIYDKWLHGEEKQNTTQVQNSQKNKEKETTKAITAFSGFKAAETKLYIKVDVPEEILEDTNLVNSFKKEISQNGFFDIEELPNNNFQLIHDFTKDKSKPFAIIPSLDNMSSMVNESEKESATKTLHFCLQNNLYSAVLDILKEHNKNVDLLWLNENGENAFHIAAKNKEMKQLLETYTSESEQKKAMKISTGYGKKIYSNPELIDSTFNLRKENENYILEFNKPVSRREENKLAENGVIFDIHKRQWFIRDMQKLKNYMRSAYPDDYIKIGFILENEKNQEKEIKKTNILPNNIENTADNFFSNIKNIALEDKSYKNNLRKIASVLIKNANQTEKVKIFLLLGDDLENLDRNLYENVWKNELAQQKKKEPKIQKLLQKNVDIERS